MKLLKTVSFVQSQFSATVFYSTVVEKINRRIPKPQLFTQFNVSPRAATRFNSDKKKKKT